MLVVRHYVQRAKEYVRSKEFGKSNAPLKARAVYTSSSPSSEIPLSARRSRTAVFMAGFSSGLAVVGVARLIRRYSHPSPDYVFNSVLPVLRGSGEVRAMVGSQLKPGLFRAYSHTGGLQWRWAWPLVQFEPSECMGKET